MFSLNKKLFFGGIFLILVSIVLLMAHFFVKPPPSSLDLKIYSKPAVMPIAYKVYGNPDALDGRFWLVKLVLTNTGKRNIRNLKISYRIPDYIDWTTPSIYKEVLSGQTVIDRFYPKFPPKIINVMNTTPSSVEIKISYHNGEETVEEIRKVNFQIRGRNDFIYTDIPVEEIADITDAYENIELLAAFVTPEDPIIKYFTQQLQQKVLKGTVAGVFNNPQEIQRFMKAIYDFQISTGMVYAGTLGLPEKVGNSYTIVQRIRLPREVLTGGAGLCVELSTLFCSIAISAGLNCGIFVTSKHAFPGIITSDSVYPIEATAIGGPGLGKVASFKEAVEMGLKNFQIWANGGGSDIGVQIGFIDINDLQSKGIRPPELSDDPTLRKKVDELFAKLEGGSNRAVVVRNKNRPRENLVITSPYNQSRRSLPTSYVVYKEPSGLFEVSIPRGWDIREYPIPENPYFYLLALSPDLKKTLEVYVFTDTNNPDEAIEILANMIRASGMVVTYRKAGFKKIYGREYVKYIGSTSAHGSVSNWETYFTRTDYGIVGFSIGVIDGNLSAYRGVFNGIINSFRVSTW